MARLLAFLVLHVVHVLFKKKIAILRFPPEIKFPGIHSQRSTNMSKRRRTQTGFIVPRTKRPIDKNLKVVAFTGITATQQNVTVFTATFPCTITGIRWSLDALADAGTASGGCSWCIQVVKDGLSAQAISTSGGADFITPEVNCVAFGAGLSTGDKGSPKSYDGNTKTMRKMMGGDLLVFSAVGQATNTTRIFGVVQFFCKT